MDFYLSTTKSALEHHKDKSTHFLLLSLMGLAVTLVLVDSRPPSEGLLSGISNRFDSTNRNHQAQVAVDAVFKATMLVCWTTLESIDSPESSFVRALHLLLETN